MCGIFGAFWVTGDAAKNRKVMLQLLKRIGHRGPDWTSLHSSAHSNGSTSFLGHQRLAIVCPDQGKGLGTGDQPLYSPVRAPAKRAASRRCGLTCDAAGRQAGLDCERGDI